MKSVITYLFIFLLGAIPFRGVSSAPTGVSSFNEDDSAKIFKLLTEARAYASQRDYEKAVEAALKAADISEKDNYEYGQYRSYKSLEILYRDAGKLIISAKYKIKAMNSQSRLEAINYERDERERLEKSEKERRLREQQKQLELEQQELQLKKDEISQLEKDKKFSKNELERRKYEIARKQLELENKKQTIDIQRETINSTFNQLSLTMEELETQRLHAKIVEDSLMMVKKNEEVSKIIVEKQNLINYLYIVGLSGLLILAASFYRMYTVRVGVQELLLNKNKEIEAEHKKGNELLLNLMPSEVAEELIRTGAYPPRLYEKATIMTVNIRNYSDMIKQLNLKTFVEELDIVYKAFDDIAKRNNIVKIRATEDNYVCASGIPDSFNHNPMNIIRAAVEIQSYILNELLKKRKEQQAFFEVLIGINTGPMIAGIIGSSKLIFDTWGGTELISAGLNERSEEEKVYMTTNTYNEIKDKVDCEFCGNIMLKNSEEISVYYLKHIIED